MTPEEKQTGSDRATTYASLAAGSGLAAWIIALPDTVTHKVTYLALLAIGGFAAGIVKFLMGVFMIQTQRHGTVLEQMSSTLTAISESSHSSLTVARSTKDALDRLCKATDDVEKTVEVHDRGTTMAHAAIIANLVELTAYLKSLNGKLGP